MMDDYLDQFCEDQLGGGCFEDNYDEQAQDYDEEYPYDEPWDEILEQQELEDFEQADEYFGFFGYDEF